MNIRQKLTANGYRGPGFDRIRLIAAAIVVVHHSSTYLVPDIAHDYLYAYSRGFTSFGLSAVDVFFALSGFLVTPSLLRTGDVVSFTVNRALRIMPALAVAVFVAIFVVGPISTTLNLSQYFTDPGTYRYAKNLLMLTIDTLPGVQTAPGNPIIVNGSLWTLYFEVLCYAFLVVISLSGILVRRVWTVGLFLGVYAFNALSWYAGPSLALVPVRIETFASLFVYFAAGVCIYRLSDIIPWSGAAAVAALACLLAGLALGIGVLVTPLSLSYLVVYLGLSDLLGRTPYRRDFSYGIYVFHALVLAFMLVIFPSVRNFFVTLPIVALVSLLIAMLSWTFVEAPALNTKKRVTAMVRLKIEQLGSTFGWQILGRAEAVPRERQFVRVGLRGPVGRSEERAPADRTDALERTAGSLKAQPKREY